MKISKMDTLKRKVSYNLFIALILGATFINFKLFDAILHYKFVNNSSIAKSTSINVNDSTSSNSQKSTNSNNKLNTKNLSVVKILNGSN